MNPSADDPDDVDVPLTRAAFLHEGEELEAVGDATEIDPARTLRSDSQNSPLAATDPAMTRVPELDLTSGSFSDWVGLAPTTKTEGGPREGSRRGIIGKIEPGQTLYGKYQVLKKLGGGAMGDVWLVRHVMLKSEHALKVIVPNFARNAVALMRFQREFEVMATLRHEHAVTIYDACIDDDGGYIDMEFVDGLTIDAILAAARSRPDRNPTDPLMPLDWIVRLLDQLTEVLQVAHEKKIVHRDLKPSNMMLLNGRKPGKEYLKVLDFGIAKVRDDPEGASGQDQEDSSSKTDGFIGTPSYGSPEQAMARDDVDGRADLYSVGIMLYEFVTGRLPFRGSPLLVMTQNASAPPPPFHEANPQLRSMPEVEHAIFRVLSKHPDHRPQTGRELFEEFREAVEAVLPSGSPGLIPASWPAGRRDFSPASGQETEHESQVGGPALLSTMEATLIAPGERVEEIKPASEPAMSNLDLVLPQEASPHWRIVSAVVVSVVVSLILAGLLQMSLRRSAGIATSKPSTEKTPRFEDYWPGGFVATGASSKDPRWPEQVRQTAEERYFNRFADGIYLPDGYTVEDPTQLVDGWPKVIVRNGIRFIRITGGKVWPMGAWDAEAEQGKNDTPGHAVKLTGFYIQETEVTNGQYADYLEQKDKAPPSEWEQIYMELKRLGPDIARQHPAVNLSRKQALVFARSLDAQLPTEAQWEYAARSLGEKRRYVWGDSPPASNRMANIDTPLASKTAPVKSYPDDRTLQGVYDMLGNVQEICRDSFAKYKTSPIPELDPCEVPSDPAKANYVIRGANFNSLPGDSSLTRRDDVVIETLPAENLGFRLVVESPDTRNPR